VKKMSNTVSSGLPFIYTVPNFFFSEVVAIMLLMKNGKKVRKCSSDFFLLDSEFSNSAKQPHHEAQGRLNIPQVSKKANLNSLHHDWYQCCFCDQICQSHLNPLGSIVPLPLDPSSTEEVPIR
jgi:hypothetical protein